jgi:hypothetical protein
MGAALVMAAVAAVLGSSEVVFVQLEQRVVLARVALPEPGAAVFAAPDGVALVPLVRRDGTAVVRTSGRVTVEPGRIFPLFFDEFDRMFVVMPEQLALLAYPQRVTITQVPLPGIGGVRHASVTANGLAVALIGTGPEGEGVWVVTTGGEPRLVPMGTSCLAQRVVLAPNGEWLGVACAQGRLVVAGIGSAAAETVSLGGDIAGLAADTSGREALVAVASDQDRGFLIRLRVRPGAAPAVRERFRTPLPRSPRALATSGDSVLVLDEEGLAIWDRGGRRLAGVVPTGGGSSVVVLREATGLMPGSWGEPGGSP